jgi:hypothetical protein
MGEFPPVAIALSVVPKLTSLMSIFGSTYIVYDVFRRSQIKRMMTLHRLLITMSLCDIIVSIFFFCSSWLIPSFENEYGAMGNWTTCQVQGFFCQFGLAIAYYNLSLTIYYVASIRWGWSQTKIRIQLEPFLHFLPMMLGIGTGLIAIPLQLYNNDSWACWLAGYPRFCNETWNSAPEDANCIRGDNATLYRWLLYYLFLWIAVLLVIYNMVMVYYSILGHEKALESNQDQTFQNVDDDGKSAEETIIEKKRKRRHEHSKRVAIQGYWFCSVFLLTWVFPTATRFTEVSGNQVPIQLIFATSTFVPWQGFFNFLVYIMPRIIDSRTNRHILVPSNTATTPLSNSATN